MPPPSIVVMAGCKTKRLRHLRVKDIEAVALVDLDEEPAAMILDAQHPMLDLHARSVLIQLSQADDGVPQRGDVVDIGE
jgi:hypothetical protein